MRTGSRNQWRFRGLRSGALIETLERRFALSALPLPSGPLLATPADADGVVSSMDVFRAPAAGAIRLTSAASPSTTAVATARVFTVSLFETVAKNVADNVRGRSAAAVQAYASSSTGSLAILQWTLLDRLGKDGREAVATKHPAASSWFLGDRDALQTFLSSGDAADGRWPQAADIFCQIVGSDARAKQGVPLRIAVATSLTFAAPVISFADKQPIAPLPRYQAYRDWDASGQLFSSFRNLTAWEMRYVVGSWAREAELVWARSAIRTDLKTPDRVSDAAFMVPYTEFNKRGVSIQDEKNFYDSKPITLKLILEYGAVCGGISKFGTAMCQAFGVPAMPVGQPGHCAFLWQKPTRSWAINNDISGWAESSRHDGTHTPWGNPAWFVPLFQGALRDQAGYAAAERLRWVAPLATTAGARAEILAAACKANPLDYAAWVDRCAALAAAKAAPALLTTVEAEAATAFTKNPTAYVTLLNAMEPGLVASTATVATRQQFTLQTMARLASMGRGGADATLVAGALRSVLQYQAGKVAPGFNDHVYRILAGETASGMVVSATAAKNLVPLFTAATDALDVATSGAAYSAWRIAAERTARGLILQPGTRAGGMQLLTATVRRLQAAKRIGDARWLADVMVAAARTSGDAATLRSAQALRTSLG
jgi:hypothetical protein